ncbi:MAG: GspH/FimT family pseudopilin [Amphritea sp.]|nr:GspH/FimT family pseudopilin [Amphritea sp.]
MLRRQFQSGVTLVELMVTVSVLAIILTVGVPSLSRFLNTTEVNSTLQQFRDGLAYARSEAVSRQRNLRVCPLNQRSGGCRSDSNWGEGMVVYEDLNGNGGLDAADQRLKTIDYSGGAAVNNTHRRHLEFDRLGRSQGSNGTFTFSANGIQRQLFLSTSGRTRL